MRVADGLNRPGEEAGVLCDVFNAIGIEADVEI
jgi:hypothetical protein